MRTYTVHVRRNPVDPDRDLILVREGFNFWAFLFGFIWAAFNGLWLVAAGLFMIEGGLSLLTSSWDAPVIATIAHLALGLLIGFFANDLRRWTLSRRDYAMEAVVGAPDRDAAEQRYLDHTPDLAAVLRP